jgi:hypothetical protein
MLAVMGNDVADAIREGLRAELLLEYGTLEAAAEALGIPYKTLYRSLTTKGKDRSQSVKLDLITQIAEHLEDVGRSSFNDVYTRAVAHARSKRDSGEEPEQQ